VTCNNNAPILQRDADFMHIVDADNLDVALISATTFGVQMPTWSGANLRRPAEAEQTLKPDDDYVLPHQLLDVRRTLLSTVGDRAFPDTAARLWNNLPSHVTVAPSLHLLLSS